MRHYIAAVVSNSSHQCAHIVHRRPRASRARRGIVPILLLDLDLERVEHEAELEGALLGALLRVARAEVAAVQVGAH
eukprot:scaffold115136_cov60-Phaeocystis_antarctica.AAC.3